jgi:hypothetical protein
MSTSFCQSAGSTMACSLLYAKRASLCAPAWAACRASRYSTAARLTPGGGSRLTSLMTRNTAALKVVVAGSVRKGQVMERCTMSNA